MIVDGSSVSFFSPFSSIQNGGPSLPKAKHNGKNDFRYLHVGYKAILVVRKMIKRRDWPPGVFLYSPCSSKHWFRLSWSITRFYDLFGLKPRY